MGNGGLEVNPKQSMPLFLLTLFPCSSTGPLQGCSPLRKLLFIGSPSWNMVPSGNVPLLQRGVLHGLQCGYILCPGTHLHHSLLALAFPPPLFVPSPLSLGCFLFSNTFSQRFHACGRWAQVCPVVDLFWSLFDTGQPLATSLICHSCSPPQP